MQQVGNGNFHLTVRGINPILAAMISHQDLIARIETYAERSGKRVGYISYLLFGHSKDVERLRDGKQMTLGKYLKGIERLEELENALNSEAV